MALRLGLVGDHDDTITAHRALPRAVAAAAAQLEVDVALEWVPTDEVTDAARVRHSDALWCVPGSPYRSEEGALTAIRHARESAVPFLGTCGGFQHAVLEWARHVLGWTDAAHGETAPAASRAVIAPLECALVEASEDVRVAPGSRLAAAYEGTAISVTYRCRYGINPAFRDALVGADLHVVAEAANGEVRGIELQAHPFFVAVLFQPEREALADRRVPLAEALLAAARTRRGNRADAATLTAAAARTR